MLSIESATYLRLLEKVEQAIREFFGWVFLCSYVDLIGKVVNRLTIKCEVILQHQLDVFLGERR